MFVCTWSVPQFDAAELGMRTAGVEQRLVVPSGVAGTAVRVLFCNPGREELLLPSAAVGVVGAPEAAKPLTAAGAPGIRLEGGSQRWSDPVPLRVRADDGLEIVVRPSDGALVPGLRLVFAPFASGVRVQGEVTFDVPEVASIFEVIDDHVALSWVSAVEVEVTDPPHRLVAFGDSLTHMETWTAPLSQRLRTQCPGGAVLRNAGVAGNRVLRDAAAGIGMFGEAGTRRFARDVFEHGLVDTVVVLEGINDIAQPSVMGLDGERVDAEELIAGLASLVDQAHAHRSRAVLCTLLPFGGAPGWSPEAEGVRQRVNAWIRSQRSAEAVLDLDELVRDPRDPQRLLPGCHTGDWLHLNPAGGRLIAEAIDLDLLVPTAAPGSN